MRETFMPLDARARAGAARALGEYGPMATAAAQALVLRLGDEDVEVSQAAARALGRVAASPIDLYR